MTIAAMTTRSEYLARIQFAENAAKHFAAHPEHWSYSDDELGPGVLLALRWGLGNDCVLVLRVGDEMPINFQQLVRDVQPPAAAADAAEAGMTDKEIVELLAVNLSRIRDDFHKVVLLTHLFGKQFPAVQKRCREVAATRPDPVTQDRLSVVELRLLVLS